MSEHYGDALDGALRTIAQQSAVIAEQKETIRNMHSMEMDSLARKNDEQSGLIEKLASALSEWNSRSKHQQGYIPQWSIDALTAYNNWKENK